MSHILAADKVIRVFGYGCLRDPAVLTGDLLHFFPAATHFSRENQPRVGQRAFALAFVRRLLKGSVQVKTKIKHLLELIPDPVQSLDDGAPFFLPETVDSNEVIDGQAENVFQVMVF